MKKSILFIADKPDWAYEFMIKAWLPFLFKDYDCYIAYDDDYFIKKLTSKSRLYQNLFNIKSHFTLIFQKIVGKNDPVYFINKKSKYYYPKYNKDKLYQYNADFTKSLSDVKTFNIKIEMAYYFQYMAEIPFSANKNIVGIFTDKFPHEGPTFDIKNNIDRSLLSQKDFFDKYLKPYDYLIVGGGSLLSKYKAFTDKVVFVYGIYREDLFIENKSVGTNDYLTIGWTGNPNRSMKGFNEYVLPAIENVRKTGRDIRLKTKFSGPYDELYTFYQDVDLVIIASDADSGPSMYAESSLSGVPCISTKVGLPLLGIKNEYNGILINRDLKELENQIKKLFDDRKLLQFLSKNVKTDYLSWMENKITFEKVKKALEN